jgi:hypothetical protein
MAEQPFPFGEYPMAKSLPAELFSVMNVEQLKEMVNAIPAEFNGFSVEFTARVEAADSDHWVREDHPVSGSFIDRGNRELVLANSEQLKKLEQYAR